MTISAVRTDIRRNAGFTLIEIILVLAISSMVVAGAVGFMVYSSDERALRAATGEIEVMAKRARTVAMLQQTPYALVFSGEGVHMMPLAEALAAPDRRGDMPDVASGSRFSPVHAQWVPEEDQILFVKRWASANWLPVTDRSVHLWRFDPDGLCEPIALRLEMDRSWMEADFHPLTGSIRESFLEANK